MSRLTQAYKDLLSSNLTAQIMRVGETIYPPFHPDGPRSLQTYIAEQIPNEIFEALALLKNWRGDDLPSGMYTKTVTFALDGVGRYTQDLREPLPVFSRITTLDDKLKAAVWEYIRKRALAIKLAKEATYWLGETLYRCATAGQIKRVIPEIVPYLTDSQRQAIDNAARASRIPKHFVENIGMKRRTLNLLATTSLLPVERPSRVYLPHITTSYSYDLRIVDEHTECKEEFWWA